MRLRVVLGAGFLLAGVGCSTVQRESQRARKVVASTGAGIESGMHGAMHKARSWWSRLFGGGYSGSTSQRRSSGGAASSNGRYETLAPQYVGTDDAVDGR